MARGLRSQFRNKTISSPRHGVKLQPFPLLPHYVTINGLKVEGRRGGAYKKIEDIRSQYKGYLFSFSIWKPLEMGLARAEPLGAGLKFAEDECSHGRLPGDPGEACVCWVSQAFKG